METRIASPQRQKASDNVSRWFYKVLMDPGVLQRKIFFLKESLERQNRTEARKNAATDLGSLGPSARSALPDLLLATTDIDAEVRAAATAAVTAIDREWVKNVEPGSVVPLLIKKLESSSAPVANAAIRALKQIGPPCTPFLTSFIVENPNKPSSVFAIQLLAASGRDASAVPALLQAMESSVMQVRLGAVRAIASVADAQPAVTAGLTERLGDEFGDVRAAAAEAISKFGPAARAAIRRLLVLLTDREDRVRVATSLALESIGPAVAAALIEVLNTRDEQRVRVWGETLFQSFQVQTEWVDLSGLRNLSWTFADVAEARINLELAHESALYLLAKFGDRASVALASILNTLKDPNPRIRLAGLTAVGTMGVEAGFAVPEIAQLLLDERSDIRVATAKTLCRISENWADDANVRSQLGAAPAKTAVLVTEALVHAGTSGLPVLTEFLASPDRVVREQAAAALGRIGAKARGAIPQLEKALSDPHAWVQAAARSALQTINASVDATV